MKWMDIAWQQEGADVREIGGPQASKTVIGYFAGIGRTDVTSDEVKWCAAFYFWCLKQAGIDISSIPGADRLLAWSATKLGTRIDAPRVGCGCVITWPDGSHHVGFVVSWTATTIDLLGGNQADSVCRRTFKRTPNMIFMWPEPERTAADLEAAGSRIVAAARQQRGDAVKSALPHTIPQPPAPEMPSPEILNAKFGALQSSVESGISFLQFLSGRWAWITLFVSLYFAARLAWNSGLIRKWRTEMTNTGAAPAATTPAGSSSAGAAAVEEAPLV